ncbi:GNAT family N-acetyltransferase [Aquimarina sp. 2201CG1-2-11]|uniref:lipid II:glycine glycyltransferase FemX n=1 Tax=Aquimarina discodermiae TaxID=3231043 RepID=UPI0034627071
MKYYILSKPTNKEFNELEEFIQQHPNGNYFQSTSFFKSCKRKFIPYYIVASQNDKIKGVLLVFKQIQIKKPFLSFLSSRNIIWGGPLIHDNDTEVCEGILNAYEKFRPKSIYTQIRNLCDTFLLKDTLVRNGFNYEEHLDILIDLTKSEEQLWSEINPKGKNKIRKAIKEGVTFSIDNTKEALQDCYTVLEEVYLRAKLPLPDFDHFISLYENSRDNEGLAIGVVKYEGKIIGCMLCLLYKDVVFDYYAGALSAFYKKRPNDVMPWEIFRWGKSEGYKVFDFGGAGKPNVPYGVRDYKLKYSKELVNYGRYEKIHYPMLYKMVLLGFNMLKKFKK